jgi:hypothetical protein
MLALLFSSIDLHAAVLNNMLKTEETAPVQPLDHRYALVGVIAEGSPEGGKGIAVIKNLTTNKSITLKVGEIIPDSNNIKLVSVRRRFASLEIDGKVVTIEMMVGSYGSRDVDPKTRPSILTNEEKSNTRPTRPTETVPVDSVLLERWVNEKIPPKTNSENPSDNADEYAAKTPETVIEGEVEYFPDSQVEIINPEPTEEEQRAGRFFLPNRRYDDPEIQELIDRKSH